MKIIAFVYDFNHSKSIQGLFWLKAHGYHDVTCIASPYKTLNVEKSKTRVYPLVELMHPEDVAKNFFYKYIKCDHDDTSIINHLQGDVAVILGARRLKTHVIGHVPIINMHPGVLPLNRGLDNLKWAIIDGLPQGVTTHFIDEELDRGQMINLKIVDVHQSDSLVDIFMRTQSVEMREMITALRRFDVDGTAIAKKTLGAGTYHTVVGDFMDAMANARFNGYKKRYDKIVREFHEAY